MIGRMAPMIVLCVLLLAGVIAMLWHLRSSYETEIEQLETQRRLDVLRIQALTAALKALQTTDKTEGDTDE